MSSLRLPLVGRAAPRLVRTTLFLVGGLAAAWGAAFASFLAALPQEVETPQATTDAIVVLTGGSGRLATGIALLAEKRAGLLFVSGVHQGVVVDDLLRPFGKPDLACCMVLGHDAFDTRSNARETAAWAAGARIGSLRLVTASYHMPRSLIEFRRALPGLRLVAHPVFPAHVALGDWWQRPGTAWLLVGEHAKYLWSRLYAFLSPSIEVTRQ